MKRLFAGIVIVVMLLGAKICWDQATNSLVIVRQEQQQALIDQEIANALKPFIGHLPTKGLGLQIRSLESERVLYQINADEPSLQASNMKLYTLSTALDLLGADYRFKTEVYASGQFKDEVRVLDGDLIIKGYGDPTWHTAGPEEIVGENSIERLVENIKSRGIRQITGRLVIDESAFGNEHRGPGWVAGNDVYNYQPEIGPLSLNRGTVWVYVRPGKGVGDPVTVQVLPDSAPVKIDNRAITAADQTGKVPTVVRVQGENTIRITGELEHNRVQRAHRLPVMGPANYFGTVLLVQLREADIEVGNTEVVTNKAPASAILVETYYSVALHDSIDCMMKPSDNFYAEMIRRTVGYETRRLGSWANSNAVTTDAVRKMGVPHVPILADGSGLTRDSSMTANQTTSLLIAATKMPWGDLFINSLPIAGVDGTLGSRMKGTPAEGKARAKTGSLTGVSALSGYVWTQDGEPIVFSIVMNLGHTPAAEQYDMTAIQDKIVVALASLQIGQIR